MQCQSLRRPRVASEPARISSLLRYRVSGMTRSNSPMVRSSWRICPSTFTSVTPSLTQSQQSRPQRRCFSASSAGADRYFSRRLINRWRCLTMWLIYQVQTFSSWPSSPRTFSSTTSAIFRTIWLSSFGSGILQRWLASSKASLAVRLSSCFRQKTIGQIQLNPFTFRSDFYQFGYFRIFAIAWVSDYRTSRVLALWGGGAGKGVTAKGRAQSFRVLGFLAWGQDLSLKASLLGFSLREEEVPTLGLVIISPALNQFQLKITFLKALLYIFFIMNRQFDSVFNYSKKVYYPSNWGKPQGQYDPATTAFLFLVRWALYCVLGTIWVAVLFTICSFLQHINEIRQLPEDDKKRVAFNKSATIGFKIGSAVVVVVMACLSVGLPLLEPWLLKPLLCGTVIFGGLKELHRRRLIFDFSDPSKHI